MSRIKRGAGILLCLILLPCMALAGSVQEICESLLNREGAWSAEYTVSLNAWVPCGETRLKMLNDLLKHLSFRTFETEKLSSVSILSDGNEAAGVLFRKPGEDPGGISFSFDPEVVYTGGSLSDLVGETDLQSDLLALPLPDGLSADQITWADAGFELFSRLPDLFPEYSKHTDVKTKLNDVGLSVKKTIVTISKDEVSSLNLTERLASSETDASLLQFLGSLVFTGRQQIILYYDGNGELLRARYSGQTGTEEDQRKVTLDWRALRGAEIFDSLSLKAPAVKGGDRDVLSFVRKGSAAAEGNLLEATLEWNVVRNNVKTLLTGSADLICSEENRLSGEASLSVKTSGSEETIILIPDLLVKEGFGAEGDVRLQYLKAMDIQLDALLNLKISDAVADTEEYPVRYVDLGYRSAEEMAVLKQQISQKTASALLQHLIQLPAEDLDFLRYELSDELWQQVLQTEKTSDVGGEN